MLSIRCMAISWLAFGVLLADSSIGICQSEGTSPVYQVREGFNDVSLFEKFSTIVEHGRKIKKVMDFDEEVITIQTVEGNPNRFRIYALKAGVTTVTIVDEDGQTFSIEVLVRGDVRHLESFIRRLYPNDTINVEEISETAVRLDGWVSAPENVSEIQAIAEQFYPDILNHMKTGGVQQVLINCTVLEVQRSKLRRLGMNFSLIRPDGFLMSTPGPITPITSLTSTGAGTTATLSGFQNSSLTYGFTRPNSVFQGFISAMREEGLVKTHSTPSLLTHNGRPANFLSGGETPVPISAGLGATGISFKEFGIQMNAVPYILGNGRIKMEVEIIVRDQDFSRAVTVAGTTTTAFKTNSANTQVEMNFGEALVIAGLVSQRDQASAQKLPFFGELPYIGAAFNRKTYEESETELIILVTPEHVAPIPQGQLPAVGPGQSTDTPVDRELFLHNILEVPKFGNDCDQCQNCLPGGHCQDPNCRHCFPSGSMSDDCAPLSSSQKDSSDGPKITAGSTKPTKATPASSSHSIPRNTKSTPGKKGASRSESSGLISPTMR